MASIKISDLTLKSTMAGTEEILINDSGTSKKMTTQPILDAQSAAETAKTGAETAKTAAETAQTAAETAETNASTSASAASTSATAAASSATSAASAQTAAESARDSALAAYDNFDDRYLGAKSSDPTTDNDGDALVAGALYFSTTDSSMKLYTGSAWTAAYVSGAGTLLIANNLSDVSSASAARTNLGVAIGTDVQAYSSVLAGTTASFTTADETKLDGIEASATADQTGAEIKTAYEGEADTNAFTDAEKTKLSGIETGADVTDATNVNAAGAVMNTDTTTASMSFVVDEDTMTSNSATKVPTQQSVKAYVDSQVQSKDALSELSGTLDDIADGTTYVKSTNDYTDAEQTKLSGIETGATADQTASEILTALKTVDGSGSGLDADTLDGVNSASFLRSDAADTKTSGDLSFSDNVKANFGAGSDLQIYHSGSHSYIADSGTGNLVLRGSSQIAFQNVAGTEHYAKLNDNGACQLYYNNSEKIATSSTGVTVTGTVAATAYTGDGSALTGIDSLPSQTGNSGKYLTTNGTTASWAALNGVPTVSSSDPAVDTNGSVGDTWVNSTSGEMYVCTDATTGENVWTNVGDGTGAVFPSIAVDFLVVAGGGGGARGSGPGGAGGYRNSYNSETSGGNSTSEDSLALIEGTTYTITVGAGGAGSSSDGVNASPGSDSSISGSDITTITSIGGGYGAYSSATPGDGGSGAGTTSGNSGGSGTSGQGFDGGSGGNASFCHGGGGGAGAAGESATGGDGGDGLASSITGTSTYRAGGGAGGGSDYLSADPGTGGLGGGGDGGDGTSPNATAGTANTGGGGGGGGLGHGGSGLSNGAAGGSGVVILRMATADYSGTTTGSPSVSTSGSDTILVYNSSGTYTA